MDTSTVAEESPNEANGEFAFETDHLALRGNDDYCSLLKYIVKLEAQKVQALKDMEDLAAEQAKALEDPVKFVQDLQAGKVKFPSRQAIADLPSIDWESYGIDSTLEAQNHTDKFKDKASDGQNKVRGRTFTDSKPESFNQLWSCEEQKRLEQLLEIYPEEENNARRLRKIAKALGTRTPLQVFTRIQKYFAKLAKAGLPIPGRAPKGVIREKKTIFYKKSTFFPQLHVPVQMDDSYDNNDAYNAPMTEMRVGDKAMLELLKIAKEQRELDEICPVWQTNTMCVGCQKTRFLGARWTDNAGTDYCTDCIVRLLPGEKLVVIRESGPV